MCVAVLCIAVLHRPAACVAVLCITVVHDGHYVDGKTLSLMCVT